MSAFADVDPEASSPPPSPGGGFWVHGPADVVASTERVGPALSLLSKLMHERAAIERNVRVFFFF